MIIEGQGLKVRKGQEFVYSLKKHTKRALFNKGQKGQGLRHPLGPVHVPALLGNKTLESFHKLVAGGKTVVFP